MATTAKNTNPKPTKSETTSGAFIRRVIKQGTSLKDAELAEIVKKYFPERTTTSKDVAWNRWDMRRKGELAPAPRATKTKTKKAKKSAPKARRASSAPNKDALKAALADKLNAAA